MGGLQKHQANKVSTCESQLWGWGWGGEWEGKQRGESQGSHRKCPFPGDLRCPTLHQCTPSTPALVSSAPRPLPLGTGFCALSRATVLPLTQKRPGAAGKGRQHPAPAGRSGGDGAVSAVSSVKGMGETDLETQKRRQNPEEAKQAERIGGSKGQEERRLERGSPPRQAGRPGGWEDPGPGPGPRALTWSRRHGARGLGALSRPRRYPDAR